MAKNVTKIFLWLSILAGTKALGQSANKFIPFTRFVASHYVIPDSIISDCYWNYAVIKATVGADNKISGVTILSNIISEQFKNSFNFIKGYQFAKELAIAKRPVVFILTVEQAGGLHVDKTGRPAKIGCAIPYRGYAPEQILIPVLLDLARQKEAEPNSIILYNPVIAVAGGAVR